MKRSARGVLLSSFSLLAFCLSHPALAQQATNDGETIDLDTVTVTATRADRPLSDVPQTVRVIERAEIEEQLQLTNSAAAVLAKLIPGYTLPTQTISSASETFRGRDLLVMIDGVPMNTPLRDVVAHLADDRPQHGRAHRGGGRRLQPLRLRRHRRHGELHHPQADRRQADGLR